MCGEHRTGILRRRAHTIGATLHQAQPFGHAGSLRRRVLRRTRQREERLQPQAVAAGGDLHPPVERRAGRAAVLTLIDRPFDRDPTQNRCHGRRANPYVLGLLPAVAWHVGFRANRGGEGQQRGQATGAQVAQHMHHLGFDRLQRIGVGLHPRAQRAGQGGHPIRHLPHEHRTAGGRCGTIRHALLLGGTGCGGKQIVPPSGGARNALSIHACTPFLVMR